ncbi:ATP synthase subunit s, mitochondrial-like [Panonychus citri]|uniref:ATP synthase subunit s, mitochondrial-like n=1 Tax=Panonychus citri TaxID=50023 RepID=UPI002307B36C|nr:ATP synthase subunit s, mitochondrial-like [Panonychus citri]
MMRVNVMKTIASLRPSRFVSNYGKLKLAKEPAEQIHARHFWTYWLNLVSNKVYQERLEEAGPEQACAEWLIRNGCEIKWTSRDKLQTDYNDMPDMDESTWIQGIKADNSSIMDIGFEHLKFIKGPEKIIFRRCHYLSDDALEKLDCIGHSLRHLQLISCHNVTDEGVCSLTRLRKLKFIKLFDLSSVKDIDSCRQHLQDGLPECVVDWVKL